MLRLDAADNDDELERRRDAFFDRLLFLCFRDERSDEDDEDDDDDLDEGDEDDDDEDDEDEDDRDDDDDRCLVFFVLFLERRLVSLA